MGGVEVGKKQFWTKKKLGAAAIVLAFAASNVTEYSRWGRFNESGPMVIPYAGCEIEYSPRDNFERREAEEQQESVTSAARKFSVGSFVMPEKEPESIEVEGHDTAEFVMDESGINIVVHKPVGVEVDEEKFAEVFHAPLQISEEYEHPEVRQLIDCWRKDILEEKKHAGTTYRVFVADGPGHCIKNLWFQPADLQTRCDADGAVLPEIELQFLGLNLVNLNIMMLSTRAPEDFADEGITETLLHESVHAYMTLSDMPLRLDPDERLAEYVEEIAIEEVYDHDVGEAFIYPKN